MNKKTQSELADLLLLDRLIGDNDCPDYEQVDTDFDELENWYYQEIVPMEKGRKPIKFN